MKGSCLSYNYLRDAFHNGVEAGFRYPTGREVDDGGSDGRLAGADRLFTAAH